MQFVHVDDLPVALAQYIDPDNVVGCDGNYGEEIEHFIAVISAAIAAGDAAYAEQGTPYKIAGVLLWDDQEGGDPPLDLTNWQQSDVTPMTYNKAGDSYYGVTKYERLYHPVNSTQFVYHLYFGGCSATSAPGFFVMAVA